MRYLIAIKVYHERSEKTRKTAVLKLFLKLDKDIKVRTFLIWQQREIHGGSEVEM